MGVCVVDCVTVGLEVCDWVRKGVGVTVVEAVVEGVVDGVTDFVLEEVMV